MTFEQFIERSPDYINLRFQYGNLLFVQEQGKYKIQAVRLAFEVWEAVERLKKGYINETVSSMEQTILLDQKDKEIDQLKAELAQAIQINEVYQEDMAKDAEKIARLENEAYRLNRLG